VIEQAAQEPYRRQISEYERRSEVAAAVRDKWRRDVQAAAENNQNPPEMPEDARPPVKPVAPRVMIADATTEKVAILLAGNLRGLVMTRSELAGWLGQFDRYGGAGADRAFYLETWDGGSHVVDRVKSEQPVQVPYASLAIIGALQPDHLGKVFGGINDGLAARFIYVWPSPMPPRRPEGSGVKERTEFLNRAFDRLRKLNWDHDGAGNQIPLVLRLETQALDVLDTIRCEVHEANNNRNEGILAGWRGKNPGRLLRLALVFELLEYAADENSVEPTMVSMAMTARAADFLDYSTAMMEHSLGDLSLTEVERHAAQLARFVFAMPADAASPRPEILNERQVYQSPGFSALRDQRHRQQVFAHLEMSGWLRRKAGDGLGRPPGDWEINPGVWGS
jgi:hypothetical protein